MNKIERNIKIVDWKDDLKKFLFETKYGKWLAIVLIIILLFWLGILQITITVNFGQSPILEY